MIPDLTRLNVALRAVGLGELKLYRWLRNYESFGSAIKKAEASCEVRMVRAIAKLSLKDWRAAAWWLERRHPESWGKRVALTGSVQLEASTVASVDQQRVVDEIFGLGAPEAVRTDLGQP